MANVDIDIDASELGEVKDNLFALDRNLSAEKPQLEFEFAQKMADEIEQSVLRNFDNTDTDDGTSLSDAFYVTTNGSGAEITTRGTGADHAIPLEEGISPHVITGDPWLAFQPENISDYPERLHAEGGYVVTDAVYWRPDKQETATGYKYILEAQNYWEQEVKRELPRKIRNAIVQSGYK